MLLHENVWPSLLKCFRWSAIHPASTQGAHILIIDCGDLDLISIFTSR